MGGIVAKRVGYGTCDQEVVGLTRQDSSTECLVLLITDAPIISQ